MNSDSESTFRILSINCRGLACKKKRRDVFHYIRQKDFSIYFLQDTHFDSKLEEYIKAEWGYECYFASNTTNARGVAILFNNNFEFKVKGVERDKGGNFIIMHIEAFERELLLVNVYGPNTDNPFFYNNLESLVKKQGVKNMILGGDWNLVMDFSIDCHNYKKINNENAHKKVTEIMENFDLIDIWRELNPERKRYTWRRTTPVQQSRLDFFLVSETLSLFVSDADIISGYKTDHSLITLTLSFRKSLPKNTFWKFNASLLKDKMYIDEINNLIYNVLREYAATPYSAEGINYANKNEMHFTISDQLLLDVMLMKIRGKTISYASYKTRKNKEMEERLDKKINELKKNLILTEEQKTELNESKESLTKIREKRMEGVLIRSKARWIEDGEKITKYFCGLEKRNYINKSMNKLINTKGIEITDQNDIMGEVTEFYQKLYEEKPVENCKIPQIVKNLTILSDEQSHSLEGEITLEEAGCALKNMKNFKSPGTDGFTVEFFKFFWSKLGWLIIRSLNEGFRTGELSSTQKEGIIICIPKGDKNKENLKNWRPITLLNVIYKIGSACIANRLRNVLPYLINEDQTGFMKGRSLGDNIRLIYDLINYLNTKKITGLLLCLDFEKAFDSLSWKFMKTVLKDYGFGNDICKWFNLFYNDIKAAVSVNGQISSWFTVKRGCRQGDPISPYIFILCAEVLASMIRQNDNIKGIKIGDVEHKIAQYADDTEIILGGDKQSFEETIETIDSFSKYSGLYLNKSKTCAVWLGKDRKSPTKYMEHLNMNWNPDKFKILGLWFTDDLEECVNINFRDKLEEIRKLYKIWIKRQITPLGRIAVLKAIILSKLIHLWILLPNPPEDSIKSIQNLVFKFIWKNKRDKISRKTAVHSLKAGGLGIPEIAQYVHALKLSWIRKLYNGTNKWRSIILSEYPCLSNLDKLGPTVETSCINKFWKDVFRAYNKFYYCISIDNRQEMLSEPIFFNERIQIAGKPFFYSKWFDKGVSCVGHLLGENKQLMTFNEFVNKYKIKTDFVTYAGFISSIQKYAKSTGLFNNNINEDSSYTTNSKCWIILNSVKKGAKKYYEIIIQNLNKPNCCSKWENQLGKTIEWTQIFNKTDEIKDIKLRWFQLRILHRILGTKVIFKKNGHCNK